MPPELPRRGVPLGRVAAEPNVATAPHTPVPPPNDTAPTARPPAPDPRPPPRQYAPRPMVRAPSLGGPPPLPSAETDEWTIVGSPAPPMRKKLDSIEIGDGVMLALAEKNAELAAKEAARRAAEAENEHLRQQLRELDRANHLPRVDVAPASAPPPKRADWAKLLFGLGGALTLFLGGAGTYLGARAASKEDKVDNAVAKVQAQEIITKPLPAAAASALSATDACRDWARATDDYHRQIFGKLGVVIPQQPNAPPVTEIKTRAPVRKPNSVTGAPVLEVLTLPPPLP